MDMLAWFRRKKRGAPAGPGDAPGTRAPEGEPAPPDKGERCTSFDQVHRRFERGVWAAIFQAKFDRTEAKDVFQNVFLRVHRRIADHGGEVPHPVAPVVLGIVEDEIRNAKRTRKRQRYGGDPGDQMPASKPSPEQHVGEEERRKKITEAALAQMTEGDRDIFTMGHAGLSIEEIAQARGITENNARVSLKRARDRFKSFAQAWYDLENGSGGR